MSDFETSPHISDDYSPLETLALRALRRYGESSPSTTDGELMLMFLDFGNEIIDEVRVHPYWTEDQALAYYEHQSDRREVPDMIVLAGLLAKYAKDQQSKKAPKYEQDYHNRMNNVLLYRKDGTQNSYSMQVVDQQE